MKTKTRLFTLISLLAAALCTVTSCDRLDADADAAPGMDAPIRFRIAVAPPDAASSQAGPQTRVSTDAGTGLTSAFTAGDCVGLYIVRGTASLQASGNYADNLALTFDGSTWTCPDMPSFPTDGSALSFYAYYPYDDGLTDPLAIAHRVSTDQQPGTPDGFTGSFLLSASATGITSATPVVELTFTHRLALLRVKLNNGEGSSEKPADGPDEVTLKNVFPALTLNLADGTTAPNASAAPATDILMRRDAASGYWCALVPAQSIERTAAPLLTFEWKGITTLAYTPKEAYGHPNIVNLAALEAGKVHLLNVTIKLGSSNIDLNHVYNVGDYYPYWGFEKWGIVYKVSDGGTSGMMMSIEESELLPWRDDTGSAGGSGSWNTADGLVNMQALFSSTSGKFTSFPAFGWCHFSMNKGAEYMINYESRDVWYIPSHDELQELKALIGKGIPDFDGNIYWSSTESSGSGMEAYSLTMTPDAIPKAEVKTEARKVRVVRQFGN